MSKIEFSQEARTADEAYQSYFNGERQKSLKVLESMASKGNPKSLGLVMWHYAIYGEYEKGITLFNKNESKMQEWISNELSYIQKIQKLDDSKIESIKNSFERQVSNTKSNAALSFKAMQDDVRAEKLWTEASNNHGHLEARFFLIQNKVKTKLDLKTMITVHGYSPNQIVSLMNDLRQITVDATGWFASWAQSGLDLLTKVEEDLKCCWGVLTKLRLQNTNYFYGFISDVIYHNRLAYFDKTHDPIANLELIKGQAIKGCPNAFATVTWNLALKSEFDEAKVFFESNKKMEKWVMDQLAEIGSVGEFFESQVTDFKNLFEYQISNAKSNVAISYKASKDEQKALELWTEASKNHNHAEAKFYLLLSDYDLNLNLSNMISKYDFSVQQILELCKTLNEISEQSQGWFCQWALKGKEMLSKVSEEIDLCNEINNILNLSLTEDGFFQEIMNENFNLVTKSALAAAILQDLIKPSEHLIDDLKIVLDELKIYLENNPIGANAEDDEDE